MPTSAMAAATAPSLPPRRSGKNAEVGECLARWRSRSPEGAEGVRQRREADVSEALSGGWLARSSARARGPATSHTDLFLGRLTVARGGALLGWLGAGSDSNASERTRARRILNPDS